jgi:nitroreductase
MKSKQTLEVIKYRRSIRKFKTEQIAYPDLQQIVEAGLYAPNGMNQQKWHFSVVQDKSLIDRMVNTMKENMIDSGNEIFANNAKKPDYTIYYGAPTVILITADEKSKFAQFDCGAAAENICLAATALNIGSCIVATGAFLFQKERNNELKRELGVPEGYGHVCSVCLGYGAVENPEAPPRKKEVVNYIR